MRKRTSYSYQRKAASQEFFWLAMGAMTLVTLAVVFFLLTQ